MKILNFLFRRRTEIIPDVKTIKEIIVVRTDERLGEIILVLPLINHLRGSLKDAKITFLMCKRYKGLAKYINCDNFLFFEKRDIFLNPIRFIGFLRRLRFYYFDVAILGGKIDTPSLTSYLLMGLIKSRFKIAIWQKGFNPFINMPIEITTNSEAISKYEIAQKITNERLPFDNSLRVEQDSGKVYDVMIFTDARKRDHLLPLEVIKDIISGLNTYNLKLVLVSGKEGGERISGIRNNLQFEVDTIISPELDDLIKIICMSRAVIVANTGVMHLSVSLRVPTCGIFVNADPAVWGYNFEPHLMLDGRDREIDINEVVNFVLCSIKKTVEEELNVLS
ncbi:MAG: glycosyltransferase family 9 protein [Myxococcota bacterium]